MINEKYKSDGLKQFSIENTLHSIRMIFKFHLISLIGMVSYDDENDEY